MKLNATVKMIVAIIVMKRKGAKVKGLKIAEENFAHFYLFYIFIVIICPFSYPYLVGMCQIGEFLCNNMNCIPHNMTCNAENDCEDWSDETFCRGLLIFI